MNFVVLLVIGGLLLGSGGPAEARPLTRAARLQEDYRAALVLHARGDTDGAVARLGELEAAATESRRSSRAWHLARQRTHRELSRWAPEALLPAALLVKRVFLDQLEVGNHAAASVAEGHFLELAHGISRDTGDRSLAAGLLASFGGVLHGRHQELAALGYYDHALELDPGQWAALVSRAAVLQKTGEDALAAALLERALGQWPQHRESRLRLAVLYGRSERREEALDALYELLVEGDADWITSLAYQEAGRLLAESGRLDEALALVEESLGLFPCDPTLPLLWVHYRERLGVPSTSLASRLAECAGEPQRSPRSQYNRGPTGVFEGLRRELREAERIGLASLERALTPASRRISTQAPSNST